MTSRNKDITSEELDQKFDQDEEDVLQHFDVANAIKKVNVDFPIWMIKMLDAEAARLGIARQAVIKTWISDRIKADALALKYDRRTKGFT